MFVVDEALQSITLREPFHHAFTMLKRAAREVAGDAGVKNAIASIGHEIEPAAFHVIIKSKDVDGRDKPGHDVERLWSYIRGAQPPARSGGATEASVWLLRLSASATKPDAFTSSTNVRT